MILAWVASLPPTIAALAAWRGSRRDPAGVGRIEAMVEDLMDWSIQHDRLHRTERLGGMQ